MVDFYEVVAEVSLPDVGNGLFIQSASGVVQAPRVYGHVILPISDNQAGMLFGSNGGGQLFAMDSRGAVYESEAASFKSTFTRVCDSPRAFLILLRQIVTDFVETGRVANL